MNVQRIEYEYQRGKINAENEEVSEAEYPEEGEGFSELIRYTLPGYFLGLLAGISWI